MRTFLLVFIIGFLLASTSGCTMSTPPSPTEVPTLLPSATSTTIPSPTMRPPDVFKIEDNRDDCFDMITDSQVPCEGLDLLGLVIGLPQDLPGFNDEPALLKRVDVVITFADGLASQAVTSFCLMVNLDQNTATGADYTGQGEIAGIERGFCVEIPEGKYYSLEFSGNDPNPALVTDDSQYKAFIRGNQVAMAIDPSMLTDATGATPDGFIFGAGDGRGMSLTDSFNGDGPPGVQKGWQVPDRLVTQVR